MGLQTSLTVMKSSLKIIFVLTVYILMCSGVLFVATHESTSQPIGLLVLAMVMTPVLVSIYGGLPIDFIKQKY